MALCRQQYFFRLCGNRLLRKRALERCPQLTARKSTLSSPDINETTEKDGKFVINEPTIRNHPDLDLSFANAQEAYKSKRTYDLFRAWFVFNLCSVNFLINNQANLLKWSRKILGRHLFGFLMKQTFYGHFVAGADQEAIKPLIRANQLYGVKSILDYSAEEDISQEEAVEAEMIGQGKRRKTGTAEPEDTPLSRERGCIPEHQSEKSGAAQFQAYEEFGDRRDKVVSARTYFYEDEKQCDRNMEIIFDCIDAVSHATEKSGLAAIKMTALGKPQLLLQMSEVLTTVKNFITLFNDMPEGTHEIGGRRFEVEDFDRRLAEMGVSLKDRGSRKRVSIMEVTQSGQVDLLDWKNLLEINRSISKLFVVPDLKAGKLRPIVESLTEKEEDQMKNMLRRINSVVKYASEKEVRIMVDAEQTYFQYAISRLTMEMMRKFNKERSVVFNTYQCYLKQAYNNLVVDLDFARREDFYFGAKLVRGAYMEQERERAAMVGYEDPINPTYDATTDMYHTVMEEVMRQINLRERGKIAVMIASHNEDTVRHAVQLMKKYNIGPDDRLICFGQLLGMCDYVSFPLGQAGYSVYKYVPFGPVDEVLPYLSRRATENGGMLKKLQKEKELLRREIWRRTKSGQLFYKPDTPITSSVG
ncbi:proline dehydrogenase 1, mitochondrial-like isoform X1 [Babylonia areolata]|uniref:proline dehydrogenase 1, mitochondrial-like isoform X1 n=1 Tax=Babylonia areolata TaxID=304850 RepID=UPI003FD4C181